MTPHLEYAVYLLFQDVSHIPQSKKEVELICYIWHILIMDNPRYRPLVWIGSTKEDLRKFPAEVRSVMGYALHVAQSGSKHPDAKPLKGFKGAGVLEVVDDYDGDTYRAVYTVKLAGVVCALHAFQKKSKKGIAMPKADIDLIRARLRRAKELYKKGEKA